MRYRKVPRHYPTTRIGDNPRRSTLHCDGHARGALSRRQGHLKHASSVSNYITGYQLVDTHIFFRIAARGPWKATDLRTARSKVKVGGIRVSHRASSTFAVPMSQEAKAINMTARLGRIAGGQVPALALGDQCVGSIISSGTKTYP